MLAISLASRLWSPGWSPGLWITYFNPHFPFWDQATISWFKLRKCGVFRSAFLLPKNNDFFRLTETTAVMLFWSRCPSAGFLSESLPRFYAPIGPWTCGQWGFFRAHLSAIVISRLTETIISMVKSRCCPVQIFYFFGMCFVATLPHFHLSHLPFSRNPF